MALGTHLHYLGPCAGRVSAKSANGLIGKFQFHCINMICTRAMTFFATDGFIHGFWAI
jgi:hypothetical protein